MPTDSYAFVQINCISNLKAVQTSKYKYMISMKLDAYRKILRHNFIKDIFEQDHQESLYEFMLDGKGEQFCEISGLYFNTFNKDNGTVPLQVKSSKDKEILFYDFIIQLNLGYFATRPYLKDLPYYEISKFYVDPNKNAQLEFMVAKKDQ